MKATINEHGELHIEAETPLESYALRKWSDENFPPPLGTPNVAVGEFPKILISWGMHGEPKS